MIFYLGTHQVNWLSDPRVSVPLMVSRRRLAQYKKWPQAGVSWVLDSGGFTELQKFGRWTVSVNQYVDEVQRAAEEVGRLVWAAPQDWMCEPVVIKGGVVDGVTFVGTGLSVAEHQERTVQNFLDLRERAPVIPVLQGFTLDDYYQCADLYESAGVDLAQFDTVGLGSVCRRQNTDEIGAIVSAMLDLGIRCHGFGCKEGAVRRYGTFLASADSLAWSYGGKKRGTCLHLASRCANHLHWALDWREAVLRPHSGGAQTALRV